MKDYHTRVATYNQREDTPDGARLYEISETEGCTYEGRRTNTVRQYIRVHSDKGQEESEHKSPN